MIRLSKESDKSMLKIESSIIGIIGSKITGSRFRKIDEFNQSKFIDLIQNCIGIQKSPGMSINKCRYFIQSDRKLNLYSSISIENFDKMKIDLSETQFIKSENKYYYSFEFIK